MPEVWAGALGETRVSSTTSGGTALTTTAGFIQLPAQPSMERVAQIGHLTITPRKWAGASVVRLLINPWLVVLKTTDGMTTYPTDYSRIAQDNSTSTLVDISTLNLVSSGDWLLVGSHIPFRGAYCNVFGTNTTASVVLSVKYWTGSWTDISATVSGVTTSTAFDKAGLVYWTVPAAWKPASLGDLYPRTPAPADHEVTVDYRTLPLYWTRWEIDTAITDTSVTMYYMCAANRSVLYDELARGQAGTEKIKHGLGGVGCIEALTDLGTASLIVSMAADHESELS